MNQSECRARAKSSVREWVFNTGTGRDAAGALVIDDAAIAEWPGRPLDSAVADLIELGAAVQLVDRMERRPPARCGGDSWARRLRLVVGVRNLDLWRADSVSRQLHEMLAWLTDDDWVIDFVARAGSVRPAESYRFLFENPVEGAVVSLYSGGLDSYAGLALELSEDTVPVLVSVVPNTRQGASQSHTLGLLQKQFGIAVPRVAVKCHLRGMQSRESSNRSRGFGFLAVAASVAAMSDIKTVHVYENGIGAINLPYSWSQGGAQSTRSMHPKTLCLAGALFSSVLDHPIKLVNTNQYRTKGELCRRMPFKLHSAVSQVMSCDTAFVHRASKVPNCGSCTSCLLRRQALWSADLGRLDRQTQYRRDVVDATTTDREVPRDLKMMLSQAARIERALSDDKPMQRLLMEFPEMIDARDALASLDPDAVVEEQIVGMLEGYVQEWHSFPAGIVSVYLASSRRNQPAGPSKGAQCAMSL